MAKKPVKQHGSTSLPQEPRSALQLPTLERIVYTPHRCTVAGDNVEWLVRGDASILNPLPQIMWSDGTPWREANLWALERASSGDVALETIQSNMQAMLRYACWLEQTGTSWQDFPLRKADRCLVRFRGHLIETRNAHGLAPSTASCTMAAVVQFYRWMHSSGLVSPEAPMWRERTIGIHTTDAVGFARTILVNSTDLAIPNRKAPGDKLEDGLLPVSREIRDAILAFARAKASEELFLMLTLGFFTGARLGTLTDIRIQSLDRAVPDPASTDLFRIAVGPGADPPVHTKKGVTGHIHITRPHLEELRRYYYCTRRLHRQSLAAPEDRNLVFLTKSGKRYAKRDSSYCAAINVEMHALRDKAEKHGLHFLRHFKFHASRCTYATELARLAIAAGGSINAIAIVKEFLLHKDESTSFRYIKFIEKTPAKEEAANAFTRALFGALTGRGTKQVG